MDAAHPRSDAKTGCWNLSKPAGKAGVQWRASCMYPSAANRCVGWLPVLIWKVEHVATRLPERGSRDAQDLVSLANVI